MGHCHWHPEREAQRKCDLCHRPMCSACSTQAAEPPGSYRLCPECLESLEQLVDRGLSLQTQKVSLARAWLGAFTGGALALALWLFVLALIGPAWYSLVQWISYVNSGLLSALFAIRFTGNRRGVKVTVPAMASALVVIVIGHYVSASLQFAAYLSTKPDALKSLVDAGIISADHGWLLPSSIVLPASWQVLSWEDFGVVLAALYVAYAFTHRLRVWQSHKNRPLPRTSGGNVPASG